jgi:hypothetical protein
MFFSYFHDYILILKLDMSRFEWANFISISFIICFSPYLDQNIGLKILYLPPSCGIKDDPLAYPNKILTNIFDIQELFKFLFK